MKKLLYFLLLISSTTYGQISQPNAFTQFQQFGSPTTWTRINGALYAFAGIVNAEFADTTAANSSNIKNSPGAQIRTGSKLWMRNSSASTWQELAFSASAGTVTLVSGTANRITVVNGTTTPVIDIASTYVGQSSITTLGTIVTGVWNGTAIPIAYGGTGAATTSQNFAFIGPTSGSGVPSFRALVSGDIPNNAANTTGSAATLTTSRNIYGGAFNGSADLTGIIASTYGGTGNGFTQFTGASVSQKTYTLPNASTTILTTNYTGALVTGILKSTTTTGALTIAVAADFPTLNQNTTGSAATLTTARNLYGFSFNGSAGTVSGTDIIATGFGGTGAATTSQNFAFIGPVSGSGAPSFRALVAGDIPALSGTYWGLDGNDPNAATSFLGTTTNKSLRFRTNNLPVGVWDSLGRFYVNSTGKDSAVLNLLNNSGNSTTVNTAVSLATFRATTPKTPSWDFSTGKYPLQNGSPENGDSSNYVNFFGTNMGPSGTSKDTSMASWVWGLEHNYQNFQNIMQAESHFIINYPNRYGGGAKRILSFNPTFDKLRITGFATVSKFDFLDINDRPYFSIISDTVDNYASSFIMRGKAPYLAFQANWGNMNNANPAKVIEYNGIDLVSSNVASGISTLAYFGDGATTTYLRSPSISLGSGSGGTVDFVAPAVHYENVKTRDFKVYQVGNAGGVAFTELGNGYISNLQSQVLGLNAGGFGVKFSVLDTANRNFVTLSEGVRIYNSTFHIDNVYNGTSWISPIYKINGVAPGANGDITLSGMTYPGAGIPLSTGSAWGTSYSTTGSGTVVALQTSPDFLGTVTGVASTWSGLLTANKGHFNSNTASTSHMLSLTDNNNGTAWMGWATPSATNGFWIGSNNALTIGTGAAANTLPTYKAISIYNTGNDALTLSARVATGSIQFTDATNGTIRFQFPATSKTAITKISAHRMILGTSTGGGAAVTPSLTIFETTGNIGYGASATDVAGVNNNIAGAASLPAALYSGLPYTAGTATTNKALVLLEPIGATSTGWSTAGTYFGVNAASGFAGNLMDLQVAGVSMYKVSNLGVSTSAGGIVSGANVIAAATGQFYWVGRSVFASPSDGVIKISNNGETDFTRLQLGGTTSSFPAIARNGTGIDFKLADNSTYAATQSLYDRFGTGDPEGVVAAPVGAVFHRTDGGTGTSFYVKETGTTTANGWVAK